MKFSAAAVLAAAAGAQAWSNATYVTETVTALTTYCPGPTEIVHGSTTYTVTEATTLTITDCPCTVTRPVTTVSSVVCHTCSAATTGYANTTAAAPTTYSTKTTAVGTISATTKPTALPTAGAGKAAALSGAGLAGVLGLAAFIL